MTSSTYVFGYIFLFIKHQVWMAIVPMDTVNFIFLGKHKSLHFKYYIYCVTEFNAEGFEDPGRMEAFLAQDSPRQPKVPV